MELKIARTVSNMIHILDMNGGSQTHFSGKAARVLNLLAVSPAPRDIPPVAEERDVEE